MGKFASSRNFGFGKQLSWAGRHALSELKGGGHFETVQTHTDRWSVFCAWLKNEEGIKDAKDINQDVIERYANHVNEMKAEEVYAQKYSHNLLSTVNVVLSALRGDKSLKISPSEKLGPKSNIRESAPKSLDRSISNQLVGSLRESGYQRAASVFELAREIGVRSQEASLANLDRWKQEADKFGKVNVIDGTKGGRTAPRWVPVSEQARFAIQRAIEVRPVGSKVLISPNENWKQFKNGELNRAREVIHQNNGKGYHDARAAYACERYQELTNNPAPCVVGRVIDKESDREARNIITVELGHSRNETNPYLGGKS